MRPTLRRTALTATIALLAATATACNGSSNNASSAQNANNQLAATEYQKFSAAVPYPFTNAMPSDPLERKNLARRLQTYNSAGDTNYVYIETFGGQVIGYYVIRGKVSSTGSQMTSTQVNVNCGSGTTNGQSCTNDAIGDDGSYGPEEGGQFGVFFYTTSGTLVETDNPFIVSSQPIRLYANVPQLDAAAK